jgi:hypothetical protein
MYEEETGVDLRVEEIIGVRGREKCRQKSDAQTNNK